MDERAKINLHELKTTSIALLGAFKSMRLWLVVLFLFLINFNPGITTAMYTHLEDKIGLPHASLAILDTMFSVGNVIGALVFMLTMSGRMPTRLTTVIGLVVGAAGMLPMLTITGAGTAKIAYFVYGLTYMIVSLSQLTVAAEACPKRVEAVVFAALMSVSNLSMQWSDVVGSSLYEGRVQHNVRPLIFLCVALTAAGLVFVPILRPDKSQVQGEGSNT